jgi:hypothetical protein
MKSQIRVSLALSIMKENANSKEKIANSVRSWESWIEDAAGRRESAGTRQQVIITSSCEASLNSD